MAAVITDGLKPGEHVVTDGASRLTDKARISVISAARGHRGGAPPRRRRVRQRGVPRASGGSDGVPREGPGLTP